MKTKIKQLLLGSFVLLLVNGCSETTGNSGSNEPEKATASTPTASTNYCKELDGSIFTYKHPEDESEEVGFTLIFQCKADSIRGTLLGLEPGEELGAFYFKSNAKGLQINNDSIAFAIVEGSLYKKPFTLQNYDKEFPNEKTGYSNAEHFYSGRIMSDSLVLHCTEEAGGCFADKMVFKRDK
jgi:hypothetical protein